jgi:hypothetical protein
MKKATGPAKVETSRTPPGAPVTGVVALLFNFDFDDAAVKPEHRAFLVEQFVPRLTAAPGLQVFLRGTASRVGNADYNLQLSRRRVEAVRDFLTSRGVAAGQIATGFTGENLSTSRIADDERDRAVEAILDASTGPARFERVIPVEALDGFHGTRSPQGMVVGTPGIGFVRLLGARGSVVESLAPGVVRVSDPFRPGVAPVVATSDSMLLRIHPGMPGRARILARLPGAEPPAPNPAALGLVSGPPAPPRPRPLSGPSPAQLDVVNVKPVIVSVAFHYVTGPETSARVTTKRKPDRAFEEALIREMNVPFGGQTRIRLVRRPSQPVTTTVLGPGIDRDSADFTLVTFASGADRDARVRIFFVDLVTNREGARNIPASTLSTPGSDIVCRDATRNGDSVTTDVVLLGRQLAHECGHCFGANHVDGAEGDVQELMFPVQDDTQGGYLIPPETAEVMHKHA